MEDLNKIAKWVVEYPWRMSDLFSKIAEELGQQSKMKIGQKQEMKFEGFPSKDNIIYKGNFCFEKKEKNNR